MSLITNTMIVRNLSEPMKAALRGSADGVLLTGIKIGTVVALIKRGLVTAGHTHYLTNRGVEVLELLERAETRGTAVVRTESLVYQVTVTSVYTAGNIKLKYTVWGGEAHGTDTWTVPTGTPAAQALEPRGWKLAGRLRFDAAAGTYGGYVVRVEQPAQVEPAAPVPYLERVSYRIQSRMKGAVSWGSVPGDYFEKDPALNDAEFFGKDRTTREFRVVEIRETHTVVG